MNNIIAHTLEQLELPPTDTAARILIEFGRTVLHAYQHMGRHIEPTDPVLRGAARSRAMVLSHQILDRLRRGPATTGDLAAITSRFGARICDLRAAGIQIKSKPGKHGGWVYWLE